MKREQHGKAAAGGQRRRPRGSINDVRAPLMLLYVAAFCGGRLIEVPAFGLLVVAVPALLAVAWLNERATIRGMLGLDLKPMLAAALTAGALYGVMSAALHLAAGVALGDTLAGDGQVPGLLQELIRIRVEVLRLGPVLAGLGGALLLAPAEETFWRGFVQHRLGLWVGSRLGLLLGAALNGGFYWILIGPLSAGAAALTGLACGVLALRSGSLVPAAACRALVWLAAIWLWPLY